MCMLLMRFWYHLRISTTLMPTIVVNNLNQQSFVVQFLSRIKRLCCCLWCSWIQGNYSYKKLDTQDRLIFFAVTLPKSSSKWDKYLSWWGAVLLHADIIYDTPHWLHACAMVYIGTSEIVVDIVTQCPSGLFLNRT